ncbi:amidohydrolase [Mesosutterella sp. OilRF-GAM-744-9]|uniref:Amidohydrolase n=1 Tax=Mesosutterella porci TaxID=2915351 RepID=A0ABS9MQY8_9BURK|nr:amidohydrolase [Mesosutterella sp. oilRF-744-WT-GAM-9]MCG5031038.1 amidohydrolase [Mesosutterella sp. oilRF-744-WT-GAM-9]
MSILVKPAELQEDARVCAEIRHQIHREPEVGLNLPHTAEKIVEALKAFGVDEIATHVGGPDVTGIVALVRGNCPGRTIGLRADYDGLGLDEMTGKPWASGLRKRMHACGHDGHVATLLAAVRWLCRHRDFKGTLAAIFQPGEEGFAGGRRMLEDGLVDRFGIEEFYALHSEPRVELGKVALIEGYATANADVFEITFEGRGGHGSRPHLARDPIVAASEAVLAFQSIVSRNVNPDDTAVVSVCSILSGTPEATSVIPQTAVLRGTCRCYKPDVQDIIETRMKTIAAGIAAAYEMKAEVKYTRLYPAMYNNPERVREAKALLQGSLGEENVQPWQRNAGGEDFAFMLAAKPGCLFRLGMKDEDSAHGAALHSQCFDFNDKAISTGASALLTIALNRMAAQG